MPDRKLAGVLLLSLLLLAACGEGAEEVAVDDGRGAEGEVLGGSISDDMIPLDQLRSQSPPLAEQPSATPSSGGTATGTGNAAPAEEPAQAEPAAEPAAGEG